MTVAAPAEVGTAATAASASPAAGDDAELDQRRLVITTELIASIRWQIFAAAVVVAAVVWSASPAWLVVPWAIGMALGREIRVATLTRLVHDTARPVAERLRAARWATLAIGISQGTASGFMVWTDRAHDAVLTMILVSLSAGALSTTALIPGAFVIYTACLLVPTALMWLAEGDAFGLGVGALIAMFMRVQHRFAESNRLTFEASFRIRRENEHLVRELASARDRAEAASRAKTRFLAAASHDLRQPLHALSLQSSALAIDPRADDAARIAHSMSHSIENLSTLLDSLLDISKLDAGTVEAAPRPIRLSRLVQSAAQAFRPLAEAKGLTFELNCPPDVVAVADPILLERLLRNLVDNAVKYTDSGTVTLTLRCDPDGPVIEVADTGRGIPAALQERVFEEFYQVDAGPGGKTRGLGLGLSIVRRLSELLGVAVTLESESGQGTRITLRLPATAAAEPQEEAVRRPVGTALRGLKVLVVDDEPAVREATALLLRRLGCEVESAGAIETALDIVARDAPAVVISDYQLLNGRTGIDLARRLRQRHPSLPILLVSGNTAPDCEREAAAAGLTLLHKPLSAEELSTAVAVLTTEAREG